MDKPYTTKDEVLCTAENLRNHSLRELLSVEQIEQVTKELEIYGKRHKGKMGQLVEKYVFGIEPNPRPEPDLQPIGIEVKTNPIKQHSKKTYVSKERLVFSMIDYHRIVNETWHESSFLKKNRQLLLLLYLWQADESILDHKYKFIHYLDLIKDIASEDVEQIRQDWEYIVNKIRDGHAHLLSEADTYYLGACTKAASSRVVQDQPKSNVKAKKRAFSFKQQYLNYLVQKHLLKQDVDADSIYHKKEKAGIEQVVAKRIQQYKHKTDSEIQSLPGVSLTRSAKGYKRSLAIRMLGVQGTRIVEFEKANITLKAVTLEHDGKLKESISFPAFDYETIVDEVWYDEKASVMCDLYEQLETKKFLFMVFRKQMGSDEIVFEKALFWNFPAEDMDKAREVWEETARLVRKGKIVRDVRVLKSGKTRVSSYFPGLSYNDVAHVRPHGANRNDTLPLPHPDELTGKTEFTKQCFWLNATYIQDVIEHEKGL